LPAKWDPRETKAIALDFRRAVIDSGIKIAVLSAPASISNQSNGNRMTDFLCARIDGHLRQFKIEYCPRIGYPDNGLVRSRDKYAFVLEIKSTQGFDAQDGNRLVLTSASQKLRRHFRRPTSHLLLTICYQRMAGQIRFRFVRLDFLQTWTRPGPARGSADQTNSLGPGGRLRLDQGQKITLDPMRHSKFPSRSSSPVEKTDVGLRRIKKVFPQRRGVTQNEGSP